MCRRPAAPRFGGGTGSKPTLLRCRFCPLGDLARPDLTHLARLAELISRYEALRSSPSISPGRSKTAVSLTICCRCPIHNPASTRLVAHVDEVQTFLGRRMLIEDPALYLSFADNEMRETELLAELVRRTGCGLLLDINNVFVSARNCGYDPAAYLADYPLAAVGEIHLAGPPGRIGCGWCGSSHRHAWIPGFGAGLGSLSAGYCQQLGRCRP